jgi:glucose-6-phosphate 1-dehydrogenase
MTGNGAPSAFKQADPCSLVVFGASGDLMHRLLVPALYNLAAGGLLPDAFALIGVGRSEMSDDALREGLRKSLQQFATRPVEEKLAQRVVGCATYVRGDVDDPVSYDRLRQTLQRIEAERGTKGNRLFYMATPPSAFRPIACQLGRSRLACEENGSWRRIIIEKPFGTTVLFVQADCATWPLAVRAQQGPMPVPRSLALPRCLNEARVIVGPGT